MQHLNRKKIGTFLLWTVLVSWTIGVILAVAGEIHPLVSTLLGVLYMFGPFTGAFIAQRATGEAFFEPLGTRFHFNTWWLVAWLLPLALAFGTFGVALLLPGVSYSPDMSGMIQLLGETLSPEQAETARQQLQNLPVHPAWLAVVQGLIAGITVNALAAFGEEIGWRGLLQRELGPLGFWRSSAVVGIIWGLWHAPLILQGHNYPNHPVTGVFLMTLMTLFLAPIISYVRARAQSVIPAAILHGTFNASYGISIMFIAGGTDLLVGLTGAAGIITMALINGGILCHDRWIAAVPINQRMEPSPSR